MKILIGLIIVGGTVAIVEWTGHFLLDKISMREEIKNLIIGITESACALLSYIFLFAFYENRKISELNPASLPKNSAIGFLIGLVLQALFIIIIFLFGSYSIIRLNPLVSLLTPFAAAITAGFVAEIIFTGIIFRLTEERLGTSLAIIILVSIFAIAHIGVKGATIVSVMSTAVQAGFMLSASYVLTRNLWFPIFLHFAWDFAEPGIFGGINPGITINQSLFASKITGPGLITGGNFGPGSSIQSLIICMVTGVIFLWIAGEKDNFIKPLWQK